MEKKYFLNSGKICQPFITDNDGAERIKKYYPKAKELNTFTFWVCRFIYVLLCILAYISVLVFGTLIWLSDNILKFIENRVI